MKPIIAYIILGAVGIAILIRCLPIQTKKRKKFGSTYREYMTKVPMWNFITGLKRLKKQ